MNFRTFLPYILAGISSFAISQDLEQIPSSKPLGLSGSLSSSLITRVADTGAANVSWVISASPTVSVYSIEFPFTVTITNQDHRFVQPFNEYGMSPRYRWMTFHGGYRSMSFSPYTLAGHRFLGGGMELTPGPVRVSGMYGRLIRAVPFDSARDSLVPAYERWGYAAKVGLGGADNFVDAIYLSAHDRSETMGAPPWVTGFTPAQNAVASLIVRQKVLKFFTFDAEAALSGYTLDTDAAPFEDAERIPKFLRSLLDVNASTRLSTALKSSLRWAQKTTTLELAYRRVDPGYQSMGAYYVQSDIEEVTIGPSVRLYGSKLRLSGKIGLARDDLLRTKKNQTLRVIGSASASIRPSEKGGLDLSYSNHSNSRRSRIDSLADSLDMMTYVNSASIVPMISFGGEVWQSVLSPSAFAQFFTSSGDPSQRTPDMVAQSYGLNYSLTHIPSATTFSPGVSASFMQLGALQTSDVGGALSIARPFLSRKLNTSVNAGATARFERAVYRSLVIPMGADLQYTLAEKHRFGLRANHSSSIAASADSASAHQRRSDLSLEISYGYTF